MLARQAAVESDLEAQFEVLHISDPAEAILDFAESDGLVVMSTHGKSGLARAFAGSVTTSVVARSTHPVVVLRPSAASERLRQIDEIAAANRQPTVGGDGDGVRE